ncbi:MAG: dihydrofolate reductase family protein [Elusimicrobia bacterium]|nr:dihydrofolate reductase family protein [Elusimicrobiota bacterium]
MNVGRLLVEGGGELHASLIQEGLADELQFFIAPKILGGKEAKTSVEGKGFSSPGQAVPVSRWSWRPIGSDLLICGFLKCLPESSKN